MLCLLCRKILLLRVTLPCVFKHACSASHRNLARAIGTSGVHDNNFITT